jgi:DNA repair protein RecN (Recombination protein N)
MLTHLQIRDFAIVDTLEVDFTAGLTVLTGETGAGKSIIVDALQWLAGGRLGADAIRHGAERAEVSAVFDLAGAPRDLCALLDEQAIEHSGELLIRRVVSQDGKSRAFLNGQAVAVQQLRDIGGWLIDIHGQHEFQALLRTGAQRALLDEFAGLEAQLESLGRDTRAYSEAEAALNELQQAARDRDARFDLLRYQCGELAALQLTSGEAANLAAEATRLRHSGRLAEAARTASDLLYDAESGNAHAQTSRAVSAMRAAAAHDPALAALVPTVEAAASQLRDAAGELARYLDALEVDPGRQDAVESRLAAIEQLARKHRVSADELPARLAELSAELDTLENVERELTKRTAARDLALSGWRKAAAALSQQRQQAAKRLSRDIAARMQTLGMAGGKLEVQVSADPDARPNTSGCDSIEFLVSANPGQPLKPIAKVASGGELSRISLAIQVSLAQSGSRCMVFDEVDAGVGGAVAEIVGRELARLGAQAQVLCVTHLAQVAAQAAQQLKVSKLTDGRTTRTSVKALSVDERIAEIARMLGGVDITDRALEHAREMLGVRGAAQSPERTRRGQTSRRQRP